MSWLDRYRLKLYIRNSIWVYPVVSIFIALLAVSLFTRIDRALGWELRLSVDTARLVMGTIAASMLSLVAISSSAVLLAVQLASAQLTPRIIVLVYRGRVRKLCVAMFIFMFTYSVAVLVRLENSAPYLTCYVAAYGFLFNLALFLYFSDGVGKTLRPSVFLNLVGLSGREVINDVYPSGVKTEQTAAANGFEPSLSDHPRVILNEVDGVVLAFHTKGLVSLAERSDCVIELVPAVGDFIAAGDPLFRLYQGGADLSEESLRKSVALGQERTLEQDPTFAFRIIVDIAAKALSPAINDPTTAVLAIDQIHHLLRTVGSRSLVHGREMDRKGQLRLVYRTPDWEDFVQLAVTEIRHYGRDSIQIMRRLRAMLDNLIDTVPEKRIPVLRREVDLLKASTKRMFPDLYDQALAETGDSQGMGGGDLKLHEHIGENVATIV